MHIKDIDQNKEQILTIIEDISALSEEAAASVEEQSASIDMISHTAQQLNEISIPLKTLMNQFRI
ncbi:hypothetical protein [Inediibacterium massiliense]|uniref:hypothetical protein n=1 Tax=Inediibacterium massiliense TaxID=1658111 RepID=UPI0006B44ED6|nr:hypothetical protein [Inediibacterium massiliense]